MFLVVYRETPSALSTTMAFVRVLSKLLRDPNIGKRIVPIIPDEEELLEWNRFLCAIYSHLGQLYEPVDFKTIIYCKAKDGQILEEGINEAGSMFYFLSWHVI